MRPDQLAGQQKETKKSEERRSEKIGKDFQQKEEDQRTDGSAERRSQTGQEKGDQRTNKSEEGKKKKKQGREMSGKSRSMCFSVAWHLPKLKGRLN